jgi:hypothetical protein
MGATTQVRGPWRARLGAVAVITEAWCMKPLLSSQPLSREVGLFNGEVFVGVWGLRERAQLLGVRRDIAPRADGGTEVNLLTSFCSRS